MLRMRAHGDVIDLVARLFGLNSYEAAQKLAQDFGIDPDSLRRQSPYQNRSVLS